MKFHQESLPVTHFAAMRPYICLPMKSVQRCFYLSLNLKVSLCLCPYHDIEHKSFNSFPQQILSDVVYVSVRWDGFYSPSRTWSPGCFMPTQNILTLASFQTIKIPFLSRDTHGKGSSKKLFWKCQFPESRNFLHCLRSLITLSAGKNCLSLPIVYSWTPLYRTH